MPEATPDLLRCPECGAGNPAGAGWCGQCLRRFDDAPSEDGARPRIRSVQPSLGGPMVTARGDAEPVWSCPACDTENPLSSDACARCGSSFTSFFAPRPATQEGPRVSRRAAIVFSAILPGAGHWVYRQPGPAIARGLLYLWSIAVSLMLLGRPPAAGRALVRGIGACFAVCGAAIWALSMLEIMRLGEGDRRPIIQPKAITWLTAGMSGLLFLGLLGALVAGR